jgi:transposase
MDLRCAGVDWASEKHDVVVVDELGQRLVERTIAHDERGMTQLVELLAGYRVSRVAIERPDGILVERLLETGIAIIAMHPNQVAAARPRYRVSGGKSDRFDAYMLAELARTDAHRFRVLAPDSDDTRALRALTRGREDLVEARVAMANQLRAELERFWPGAARVFADIDSPIALAFLERYPSPRDAAGLGPKRMAAFLARHGYCGRKTPEQLLERLRSAATGRIGPSEQAARRHIVHALVTALKALVIRIAQLTREIAHAVRAHPDGPIFLSFFRDPKSVICAATLLAEIGDDRARYPTANSLAADAGMTPVAIESGKRKTAVFRRGCDHRLRAATSTLADATRHWHPWAQDTYARARQRGHDHPRAIRTLGRAWTRVLWRCWRDHTPYDPARHHGLQHHIAVVIPDQSSPRLDPTATQRMASAAVTHTAAQRAEREALADKPTSATDPHG